MQNISIIPLRLWLPILVFGMFLLLGLIFSLSIRQHYEDGLYARSVEYIKQDMSELSRDMMERLLSDNYSDADRLLTRKASKRSYSLLVAVDASGQIYSSTDKKLLLEYASSSIAFDSARFKAAIQQNKEIIKIDRDNNVIQAYYPITFVRTPYDLDEKQFGALYLVYDLTLSINELWKNTWNTVQLSLLTGLMFIMFFYALLNRFINSPLKHLTNVTRRIAQGELGVKSQLQGSGEFADLNEVINTLSQQLKDNIEQLQQSEQQKKEILWASNVGTWVWDIRSGELSLNDRWAEILGYEPGQLDLSYFDDWQALIHPDDEPQVRKALDDKLAGRSSDFAVEMRLHTRNKEWRWIKVRGRIVERDNNDEPVRMSGTITDIQKRKSAEEAMLIRDRSMEKFIIGVLICDATKDDNPIMYCNERVTEITGYTLEDLRGKNCRIFQGNDDQPEARAYIRARLKNHKECNMQLRNYRKDGSMFWNDLKISPVFNEQGKLTNFIASLADITEKKKTEEQLNILSRAVESTESAMIILDRDLMIEYVNPAYVAMTGYEEEELVGRSHTILISEGVEKHNYHDVWPEVMDKGIWKGIFENTRKNGELYQDKCTISAVRDKQDKVTHFICIHEDITREYELNQQLNYEATHDKLTRLINRNEFERRANRLISSVEKNDEEHAMFFMDLDQFKIINDSCGHSAGDELLRQVSMLLISIIRKRDTLARLGGDEFAVLMEHCTIEHAHRAATDILDAIQDFTFSWEGRTFKLGISIGLVRINNAVISLQQLMKQGDTACYMAKDLGRNRIHVYHMHDQEIAIREGEMQWVEKIYQALEQNQFCFYAQPIMKTRSGVSDHYELLIRMIDNNNETIPPGAFLPAAERYNIISKIDQWVVDHVIELLSQHSNFLDSMDCISINLSGQSLADSQFIEHIHHQLSSSRLKPSKLCFEITETSAISNLQIATEFIQQMRGIGCRFSLDDFGSGLSSFAYLKHLQVDYLKIDGLFVKDIANDKIDLAMVKSMHEMGAVMGMETIAEFVENDQILHILKGIGVDYVQGYGIAKPRLLQDILDEYPEQKFKPRLVK